MRNINYISTTNMVETEYFSNDSNSVVKFVVFNCIFIEYLYGCVNNLYTLYNSNNNNNR